MMGVEKRDVAKGGKISFSAFCFFALFFLNACVLYFWLCARERYSIKTALSPTSLFLAQYFVSGRTLLPGVVVTFPLNTMVNG
jgi:hypothetical protein